MDSRVNKGDRDRIRKNIPSKIFILCIFTVSLGVYGCKYNHAKLFSTELTSFQLDNTLSIDLPKGYTLNRNQEQIQGTSFAEVNDLLVDGLNIRFGNYKSSEGVTFYPKKELAAAIMGMKSNYTIQGDPIINTGKFNQIIAIWSEFSISTDGKSFPVLALAVPFPQDPKGCSKINMLIIIDQHPPTNQPNARISQIANSIKVL